MSAQLALDALPEWRTRDGQWPWQAHQRGWVLLPYDVVGGRAGTLVEAWVCCRCGGVDLGDWVLAINHGCCFLASRQPCRILRPRCSRGPGFVGHLDLHWMPERTS